MTPTIFEKLFIAISNFIDNKLKTPTGKLTLVIINCVVLGGAVVNSYNKESTLEKTIAERDAYIKKVEYLQTTFNNYIATSTKRCNDALEEGALFQQRMKNIYNQKEEENYRIIEENKRVLKEREVASKEKINNIKALTNLKNQ